MSEEPDVPQIYRMKLHEVINVGVLDVMRVAGGWIYGSRTGSIAFVPYDNSFYPPSNDPFIGS